MAGLQFVYDGFWNLSSSRSVGMSLGTIPWSEIYNYALVHGCDDDDISDFVLLIRRMDQAYIGHYNKLAAQKSAKN